MTLNNLCQKYSKVQKGRQLLKIKFSGFVNLQKFLKNIISKSGYFRLF